MADDAPAGASLVDPSLNQATDPMAMPLPGGASLVDINSTLQNIVTNLAQLNQTLIELD